MSTRLAKRSVPMFLAATLDVGYSTFGLGRYLQFNPKKVPPPTPDGREGRLFPPEQSSKTPTLLNELRADGNNFIQKRFSPVSTIVTTRQTQEINHRKKSRKKSKQREAWRRRRKAQARRGCTSVRHGF